MFMQALQEKITPAVLGKITIPRVSEDKGKVFPVTLRSNEFKRIHETFLN